MTQFLKDVAVNLYKDKYGRTPADDGLSVLIYDSVKKGFWYASSEDNIKTFIHYQEISHKTLLCYMLVIIVTAVFLMVFLSLSDSAETNLLVTRIWALSGLVSSLVLSIFFFIKKKQIGRTVFLHFNAPRYLYEDN